jgi:hypothetical protein
MGRGKNQEKMQKTTGNLHNYEKRQRVHMDVERTTNRIDCMVNHKGERMEALRIEIRIRLGGRREVSEILKDEP